MHNPSNMKPIGGFLEFELPQIGQSYHPDAVALSTGRGGIRYILQHLDIRKCYVPFYSCDSVLDPFELEGVEIVFYEIDEQLEPKKLPNLAEQSYFLYINFFGIKSQTVDRLLEHYGDKLIIDNVHVFFSKGYPNNWSFTSARKYFGVPDGAYVYPPVHTTIDLPTHKYKPAQINHLINRLIGDRELAYHQNLAHEESLSAEVKAMSTFSEKMLNAVDYDKVAAIRRANFEWLHQQLQPYNQLQIDVPPKHVCFRYPFLPSKLIPKGPFYKQQLFIPSFWSDVYKRTVDGFEWEKRLSQQLFPLPIDHRYDRDDLKYLVDFILEQL